MAHMPTEQDRPAQATSDKAKVLSENLPWDIREQQKLEIFKKKLNIWLKNNVPIRRASQMYCQNIIVLNVKVNILLLLLLPRKPQTCKKCSMFLRYNVNQLKCMEKRLN